MQLPGDRHLAAYLAPYIEEIQEIGRLMRRISPALLSGACIMTLFLGVYSSVLLHKRLSSSLLQNISSSEYAILYAKLVNQLGLVEWVTAWAAIIAIVAWVFLARLCFDLTRILVAVPYYFIYPVSPRYVTLRKGYQRFLRHLLGRKMNVVAFLFFIAPACYVYFRIRIWEFTSSQLATVFGRTLLVLVPLVYMAYWCQFLRISASRRPGSPFEFYLFSQSSIRSAFKTMIDALLYLALLFRILLPGYFLLINLITAKGVFFLTSICSYSQKWAILDNAGMFNTNLQTSSKWIPPAVDALSNALHPLSGLSRGGPPQLGLPSLMAYMFLVVTFVGLLEIGIPVVARTSRVYGYRKALKRIFINMVKAVCLLLVLQVLVKKAYLIDISQPIGIGVIFSLLLSFFFAQDSNLGCYDVSTQQRGPGLL